MTTYLAFGLHIRSERPLPELLKSTGETSPDVDVRWRAIPEELEGARYSHPIVQAREDDILITIRGVARFLLHAGREITIAPHPESESDEVRAYLLGTILGLLCHQRELLPLHANAIALDGQAFAFAGPSGVGKSTLAAYFQHRGHRLLTDDVCVLSFPQSGVPLAWPGIPRIRLWKDSARMLDKMTEELKPIFGRLEKYNLPCELIATGQGLPLQRIYILDIEGKDSSAEITPVTGAEAMEAVMAQTFRREFLGVMDSTQQRFLRNIVLLRRVAVFHVPWHHDYDALPAKAERLEQHIRSASIGALLQ